MVPDRRALQEILSSLKGKPWEGSVYRLMLLGHPPDKENTSGARWNPPELAAIYTSLQAATSMAEVEYHLSRQPRPVRRDLRKTLHEIRVKIDAVVDLTLVLPELARIGAGRDNLFGADLSLPQEIGRSVTWFGFAGLLVPSARAEGLNLVVYPSYAAADTYHFEVVASQEL